MPSPPAATKDYFTIHDFVKAYKHFADPEWDGEPLEPEEPKIRGPRGEGGDDPPPTGLGGDPPEKPKLVKVTLSDGKARQIQHMVMTSFWGPDGKQMTSEQFLQQLFGDLPEFFKDEQELRDLWSDPETRRRFLEGLAEKGYNATDELGDPKKIRELFVGFQRHLFDGRESA